MRKTVPLSLVIIATVCGPAAIGDMVSFGATRQGSTYRGTYSPGGPVNAMAPYTPLFLVRGGSNIHRGFMVFDLSSVPSGATISSVRFEFTQDGWGSTMQILGGYQSGELAYDTYFNFNNHAHPGIQVSADDAPFSSMTTDGSLFGSAFLDGANHGQAKSIDLASNGALGYFQSQIGGQVLLFTHLLNDLTDPGGWHGSDNGGYPTLRIEYDTLVVPAPSASLLALIGLGASIVARRRTLGCLC